MRFTKSERRENYLGNNSYSSPCEKCGKKCSYPQCTEWTIRYRYRQKLINGFAKRYGSMGKPMKKKRESFVYLHPIEIERYLKQSPCSKCPGEKGCDTPCGAYLAWYNARNTFARKKLGIRS